MKLQICAEIEGLFLIKDKIEAKLYPYEFLLFNNESRFYISITKPVNDYIEYVPQLYVKDGITHIKPTNPLIYKDLVDWLCYIEAMGAFNFEISKIHIDELEVNWICENDEERGQIPITTFKTKRQERKAEKYIVNNNLSNLVIFRKMLPEAHIPFSYYRMGHRFFEECNYYFAFINYFMMLEFLFSDGNFHKKGMTDSFKKSKLLKLCVLSAVSMIKRNEDDGNYKWLYDECILREKDLTFEGIIYIFIEYRGLLSHASSRSKQYLFNDHKLRPLAFIISMVCFWVCGYIQVYCCSSEEGKIKLMDERIELLEKEFNVSIN